MSTGAVYRVKMQRVGGWAVERDLTGDQEKDAAKIDNKPSNNDYTDRGIGRLKTATGEVSAIIRNSQGQEHVIFANPELPGEFRFPNGETYRLEVTTVTGPEKPTAVDLATAPVKPPKVTLARVTENNQDGIRITFEPTSTPAIFTIAPEGAAKPLGLPSFPFPQRFPDGVARTQVSTFIPIVDVEPPTTHGEGSAYLLRDHTHVRLGVRGAGLFVRGVKIPAPGAKPKVIKPESFQFLAAQVDAKWTNPNTVAKKHGEKAGLLQYA